jgi:hypothetical protein
VHESDIARTSGGRELVQSGSCIKKNITGHLFGSNKDTRRLVMDSVRVEVVSRTRHPSTRSEGFRFGQEGVLQFSQLTQHFDGPGECYAYFIGSMIEFATLDGSEEQ